MGLWAAVKRAIGKHSAQPKEEAKVPSRVEVAYSSEVNAYVPHGAEEILNGYRFCATLSLRTPLKVLEHHDERHPGPAERLPRYGESRDGIWIHQIKSWSEITGRPIPEIDCTSPAYIASFRERLRQHGFGEEQAANAIPNAMASDIGPIPQDGGDYLHFLKDFRRIVESGDSLDKKVAKLNGLFQSNATYTAFAKKHGPDLATAWFAQALGEILGISQKRANVLFSASYRTLEELKTVDDLTLQKLPGIGPGTVKKIREVDSLPLQARAILSTSPRSWRKRSP
jgi:Helix-hairpin-helix domain